MSNGKIVEEGRHEELMASKTFYYQLVSSQNDTAQSNQKKVQHDTKMVQTIQSFGKLELSEVQTQEVGNLYNCICYNNINVHLFVCFTRRT